MAMAGKRSNGETKLELTFVTGNAGKLKEMQSILGDSASVTNVKLDLPELQGATPEDISKDKVKLAFERVGRPVVIEDTSLCFDALGGLPGPYIKWFSDKLGNDGLAKMLTGYEDKGAKAVCIFAYLGSKDEEPLLFTGIIEGSIVAPVGDKGFGWDPIFKETSLKKTFAEMEPEEKNTTSHRRKALDLLKEHFACSPSKHRKVEN